MTTKASCLNVHIAHLMKLVSITNFGIRVNHKKLKLYVYVNPIYSSRSDMQNFKLLSLFCVKLWNLEIFSKLASAQKPFYKKSNEPKNLLVFFESSS